MPRNGSGVFNPITNSWSPAINGVSAATGDWNAILADVSSAITQSVSADGQTPISGNQAMSGNKFTGLGPGTATGDSLRWEQLFSQGQPADIASASVVDIGAQLTTTLNITGTTTITSFGTNYNGPRFLRFDGALTLTHGAALVLPGAANITTAAGDSAIVIPLGTPAAGWRVVAYQRASGEALIAPASSLTGTLAIANGGTGQTSAPAALAALGGGPQLAPISAAVASNSLTITLNPTALAFRSSTLGDGTVNVRTISAAISLTVSSGSTLGTTNGALARLAVLALDNAGTVELAVVNLAGGVNLNEEGLISTTAEGGIGAADSASTVYSTTARTNAPYRLMGFIESTQATAGIWANSPSLVHASDPLAKWLSGYGQKWQDVSGSRVSNTVYTNTTGRPIQVSVSILLTGANGATLVTDGASRVLAGAGLGASNVTIPIVFTVEAGSTYQFATPSITTWWELR